MNSNILRLWDNYAEFSNEVFCITNIATRRTGEIMHEPRFTAIHSSQRARPFSNSLEISSLRIFWQWFVLKCLRSVQEPPGIFQWGFWQIVTRSIVEMALGPKTTLFPKRKATSEKVCFFFRRVYIMQNAYLHLQLRIAPIFGFLGLSDYSNITWGSWSRLVISMTASALPRANTSTTITIMLERACRKSMLSLIPTPFTSKSKPGGSTRRNDT